MAISPYIEKLRAHVGNDLLLIPTVSVLVEDNEGRILLGLQPEFGRWATIGGAIEPEESPRDAARREVKEEIGIDVELTTLLDVVGGPDFVITYANGDRVSCVSSVFRGIWTGGSLCPDQEEVTQAGWFAREELASAELTPFAATLLRAVGYLS